MEIENEELRTYCKEPLIETDRIPLFELINNKTPKILKYHLSENQHGLIC